MKNISRKTKQKWGLAIALFLFAGISVYFFSQPSCAGGLVPCKNDCNFCYLLIGFSNIFQYLMGSLLLITVILGLTIGGLTYLISGVFPKILNFAKTAITNTAKGAILSLIAWLIINSIMNIIGYKNPLGGHWWEHVCSTQTTGNVTANSTNTAKQTTCDPKNKKLESIIIQCAEQKETLADNGSGFYVALDTLSEDEKGKTKQLKAIGKYSCDGTTSEEDITQQAEWKASDETQIKVAKGLVAAVTTSLESSSESPPYVEAKYQEKSSNQAKVYINSCPNTKTADIGAKNMFSFLKNNTLIQEARAQSSDPAHDSLCASCGQAETCHYVAGNKDKKPPFVIILMRRNDSPIVDGIGESPCKREINTWTDDSENRDQFGKAVNHYVAPQMEYIPEASKGKIALYYSDLIGSSDSSCPSGEKFTSYGYVYSGKGDPETDSAFSQNKTDAYYCSGTFSSGAAVFAHEHIGHIIGKLDDEYESSAKKNEYTKHKCFTNCTFNVFLDAKNPSTKPYCRKWTENYGAECINGCYFNYSGILYRSVEDGIMNDGASTKWGPVDEELINDHVQNWPDGGKTTSDLKECRNVGAGCGATIVNNIEAMTGWRFTCLNIPELTKLRFNEGFGDCSSTTSRAYTQAGCKDPGHSTFDIISRASPFSGDASMLKAGDALVWNNGKEGHVGICLDDGCTRIMGACTNLGIYPNCNGAEFFSWQAENYGTVAKVIKISDLCSGASCQNQ
jgi:hypothetical protein